MAEITQTFRKDPDAKLDYGFNWFNLGLPLLERWLASEEIITESIWTVPIGITKESDEKENTSTKIWLSGGIAGEEYVIANKITTSDGRIAERSFVVQVENR